MSLDAIRQCWREDFPLEGCRVGQDEREVRDQIVLLVALAVADTVNDGHDYEFFASIAWLAAKARVSEKRVTAVLAHLVRRGVLTVVQRKHRQPVRYRWAIEGGWGYETTVVDRTKRQGRPDEATLFEGTKRPSNQKETSEEEPVTVNPSVASDGGEMSAGQQADAIQKAWWNEVKRRTGRYPVGFGAGARGVLAFKGLITPFLEAGVTVAEVKRAVLAIYESGGTFTRQAIERELDGRRPKRAGRQKVTFSREHRYDDEGNLILERT